MVAMKAVAEDAASHHQRLLMEAGPPAPRPPRAGPLPRSSDKKGRGSVHGQPVPASPHHAHPPPAVGLLPVTGPGGLDLGVLLSRKLSPK